MASPSLTVCENWATVAQVRECSPCSTGLSDAQISAQLSVASDLLFQLSGRKFPGTCTDTVRPCACPGLGIQNWAGHYHLPPGRDWDALYLSCGLHSGRPCGCPGVSEITLGGYPVVEVTEVKVDGAVLNSARYRIDDYRYLVRLPDADGTKQSWPTHQDMTLADTEDNTFSVTFTYGNDPPPSGVEAAKELACHLALACQGSASCRLPQRVQEITRQGVTMVLGDPNVFLDNGRTGLPLVDLFLLAHGHGSNKRGRGFMVSPGRARRPVRRAGT